MIEKFFHTEMNWVLTLLRITLGLVMLPHGLQKLFGWFGGFGFTATVF
jgi:putative oxidoreductase